MVVIPFRADRVDTTAVNTRGVIMSGRTMSTIFERIPMADTPYIGHQGGSIQAVPQHGVTHVSPVASLVVS